MDLRSIQYAYTCSVLPIRLKIADPLRVEPDETGFSKKVRAKKKCKNSCVTVNTSKCYCKN